MLPVPSPEYTRNSFGSVLLLTMLPIRMTLLLRGSYPRSIKNNDPPSQPNCTYTKQFNISACHDQTKPRIALIPIGFLSFLSFFSSFLSLLPLRAAFWAPPSHAVSSCLTMSLAGETN